MLTISTALLVGVLVGAAAALLVQQQQIQSARESLAIVRRFQRQNDLWLSDLQSRLSACPGRPAQYAKPLLPASPPPPRRRSGLRFQAGLLVGLLRGLRNYRPAAVNPPARRVPTYAPDGGGYLGRPRDPEYVGRRWAPNIEHTAEIPRIVDNRSAGQMLDSINRDLDHSRPGPAEEGKPS